MKNNSTTSTYNIVSCAMAFSMWGAWAYYINKEASSTQRLISGIAQGITSALITLIVIKVITRLFNSFERKFCKYYFPTIIVNLTTISITSTIHYLVGTPNILYTVLPGFIVGVIFSSITTLKLVQVEKKLVLG